MKAKDISGQAPGGRRTRLAEVLPLTTPFVIQIFPAYACNFKCCYCIFSVEEAKHGFISDVKFMDFDLFRRCVDDIGQFPDKVKVLRFVGIGEPLLHKRITDMIACAVSAKVAGTVELLTNASLLTPEISDKLIAANVSRLVVSVQGTTGHKYRETSGAKLDFDVFVRNLKYFFDNKRNTHVYIKIVDTAIEDERDRQRFFDIYGRLCDTIAVEHTVPIHSGINYRKLLKGRNALVTQFGLPVSEVQICPQPFFTMQINPDGKVVPCYSYEYPGIMGDCNVDSVKDIWNGVTFRRFRRAMLDGTGKVSKVCARCSIIKHRLFPEDVLNNDADRLRKCFEH